jgi:hypothetical protein
MIRKLEISRLESELAAKDVDDSGAENILLQNLLEDATKAKEKLERDYLQVHAEKLIVEARLKAALSGGPTIDGYVFGLYCFGSTILIGVLLKIRRHVQTAART